MKHHVTSADEWLYPDSETPAKPTETIELWCARGARCAAQILLRPVEPGAPVSWLASGDYLPDVSRLVDVMVEHNTRDFGFTVREGDDPAVHVSRQSPFRVYDALEPLPMRAPVDATAEAAALYVQWLIPRDAEPGHHRGMLAISVGDRHVQVPVELHVAEATLPKDESLRIVNWFNTGNMATRHGLEPWSDAHWTMIRRYGELMRRARQTDFIPSVGADVLDNGDGTFSFDFSRMERIIRLYIALGFRWINGPHIAGRANFDAPEFILRRPDRSDPVKATSPEGYDYLAQYLTAWREFMERNRWMDRLVQHVADEPTDKCFEDYRVLAGIVRKFLPGVPIIDALGLPELGGAVDIWVPIENAFYERRDEFDAHRANGDTMWYYTCCIPGGKYLNRLLDMPLIRTRYLHWANYVYDMPGYLHWGLNQYRAEQDPFEQTCGLHGGQEPWLPTGDTHVVYPGPDGPWSSVRLEAEAMGAEDYELLRLVAERDESLADEIATSCLRTFQDYTEDVGEFDAAHKRLLEAASDGPVE